MDENNSFLSSYKQKMNPAGGGNSDLPAAPQTEFRYEQKSGFVKPKKKEPGAPPPSGKNLRVIIALIVAALLVVAGVIWLITALNKGAEVMDFTGMTKNDASLWADQNGVLMQFEEAFNDQVDEGRIISQSVPKGQGLKKGEVIKLTVSKGHDLSVKLALPDLMSMTKDEVDAWAAQNFMAKVRITAEFNDKVPAGKVISFQVNDNTVVDEVTRNTPIYVIVSKGVEDESTIMVTVPDFKEKTIAESYTFANENGLTLTVTEQYDDYAPKGTIMSQSVKADEKVKKGTEIKLTVSKGKLIKVPDFSGYSKEKAAAEAGELGITVSVTEKYSGRKAGAFISQSIDADAEYTEGDVVELVYSLGNSIVLPSFVGQMRDAIESWAQDLNDKGASIRVHANTAKSNTAKGTIIYQSVSNKVIGVSASINITVSAGKVVYVPDFRSRPTGYYGYDAAITKEEAIAMCEELKLIPVFIEKSKSGKLANEVWDQSVNPGTEVQEGTTIKLTCTPNQKVKVEDIVGMQLTKNEAKSKYYRLFTLKFVYADTHDDDPDIDALIDPVIAQSLRQNTWVAKGTELTLTLNPRS